VNLPRQTYNDLFLHTDSLSDDGYEVSTFSARRLLGRESRCSNALRHCACCWNGRTVKYLCSSSPTPLRNKTSGSIEGSSEHRNGTLHPLQKAFC